MSYPIPSVDPTEPQLPEDDVVLGDDGERIEESEDESDPDAFDRYEDRAEQWQRDYCELSAPNESY